MALVVVGNVSERSKEEYKILESFKNFFKSSKYFFISKKKILNKNFFHSFYLLYVQLLIIIFFLKHDWPVIHFFFSILNSFVIFLFISIDPVTCHLIFFYNAFHEFLFLLILFASHSFQCFKCDIEKWKEREMSNRFNKLIHKKINKSINNKKTNINK